MKGMYTRVVMMLLSFALLATPAQAAFVTKAAVETSTVANTATATAAASSWKSMSRAERKTVRKQLKETLRTQLFGADVSTNLILLTIITILIIGIGPAIAMLLHEGTFNNRVLLSLILGLLGHIPGVIYNLYIFFGNK